MPIKRTKDSINICLKVPERSVHEAVLEDDTAKVAGWHIPSGPKGEPGSNALSTVGAA